MVSCWLSKLLVKIAGEQGAGRGSSSICTKFSIRSLNSVQLSPLNSSELDNVVDIVTEQGLKDRIRERILKAGWINLKTLLGNNFRLFVNQKVPDLGVSGGKIPGLFPWTLGIDPLKNPTPHTPHPTPHENLFQQTLNSWAKNWEKQQKSVVSPLTNSQN